MAAPASSHLLLLSRFRAIHQSYLRAVCVCACVCDIFPLAPSSRTHFHPNMMNCQERECFQLSPEKLLFKPISNKSSVSCKPISPSCSFQNEGNTSNRRRPFAQKKKKKASKKTLFAACRMIEPDMKRGTKISLRTTGKAKHFNGTQLETKHVEEGVKSILGAETLRAEVC